MNPFEKLVPQATAPAALPQTRSFRHCPRCKSETKKATSVNNSESEFWYECKSPKCNTYINTYIPQDHQRQLHEDSHRFIANFGGYGTGKTLTSRQELYKHVFLTPNGNSVVGANVISQYEQTIKRDILQDLPAAFVSNVSVQKQTMDFINGHRIMFRPFDDPDKLRSYNISFFIILEASETKYEALTQLKSRIRNTAATKPKVDPLTNKPLYHVTPEGVHIPIIDADWRRGIIESNPDSGWIRSEVLYKSSKVYKHGEILDKFETTPDLTNLDPSTSSHVAASSVNKFLPPTFLKDLAQNKPDWWIRRYLYGSFLYAEGLVYPSAMTHVVPTFEVSKHWKRIIAYDYGLSDDSVFLFGAVDEIHNLLFIYKEVRTNNRSVKDLADMYHEYTKDIPSGGLLMPPLIDPKSGPKRDYNKKSLSDHFLDYGIAFTPGQVSIDARIFRLNTYFECGKIKIMDCCRGLVDELREYKFAPKSLDKTLPSQDKPEDKNNHAINPLEWIVMELPADPKNLLRGVYSRNGLLDDPTRNKQTLKDQQLHALSDYDYYDQEASEDAYNSIWL